MSLMKDDTNMHLKPVDQMTRSEMQILNSLKSKPSLPGPGSYDVSYRTNSQNKNSRKFSIGIKLRKPISSNQTTPGPHQYRLNTSQTKNTKPKYGIGGHSAQRPSLVDKCKLQSPNLTKYFQQDISHVDMLKGDL